MACESGMGHTSDVILGNLKQEVVRCLVSDDPLDVVSPCTEWPLQDSRATSSSELGLQAGPPCPTQISRFPFLPTVHSF